jgi:hypothetical protein
VDLFASQGPPDAGVGGILDEIGLERFTSATRCPNCGGDMQAGAVICVRCGFNTQTGKQLRTVSDTDAQQRRDAAVGQAKRNVNRPGKSSTVTQPGELTPLEVSFCIIFFQLALLVGLIYLVTGNPKGKKMLMISGGVALVVAVGVAVLIAST